MKSCIKRHIWKPFCDPFGDSQNSRISKYRGLKISLIFLTVSIKRQQNCNGEEQNLTPCCICFFYFKLCSLMLFVTIITKRMLSIAVSIHNGLPWGTLHLCLNVKLKCLCSAHRETFWPCPPMNGCRKEEINTSPPRGWPSQEIFCKTNGLFTLLPHCLPLSVL